MKEETRVRYFGRYLQFFTFQQFIWRGVHGLADMHTELTDAQLRTCIDDVCEYMRQTLTIEGLPLAVDYDAHLWLKDQLTKKLMGPTKGGMWIKGK